MTATYTPPSVTLNTQQPPQIQAPLNLGRVIYIGATFPQGPDYPVLVSPQQMVNLFGDPTNPTSIGYTGPYLSWACSQQKANPATGNGYQYLVQRFGVTRARYNRADGTGSAVGFYVEGIGPYAGSAGNRLRYADTVASNKVTSITITDSVSGATVFTVKDISQAGGTADLSSFAKIVQAINSNNPLTSAASMVYATLGAGTAYSTITTQTTTAFGAGSSGGATNTLGADGLGTSSTAVTQTALQQSLWTHADYMLFGWDASAVQTAVLAHVNTDAPSVNELRKAILGPAAGTTFTALSSGYVTANNDRVWVVGNDNVSGKHPATQTTWQFDGFYLAAAYAGLKATAIVAETCAGMAIAGFSILGPSSGKTSALLPADMNTLATAGFMVFQQSINASTGTPGAISVRDAITTAPYASTTNSSLVNPMYEANMIDIDDLVNSTVVNTVSSYLTRPRATSQATITQLTGLVQAALGGLGGNINGVNYVNVTVDPNTLVVSVNDSYISRFPIVSIANNSAFTLA